MRPVSRLAVGAFCSVTLTAHAQAPPAFPTPDLNERVERMVEAGVPRETAEKVKELTAEVQKLQATTPVPGSHRAEDLSPASRKHLELLLERGVPLERAVQMLLLQEKYQDTLKDLQRLPAPSGIPGAADFRPPTHADADATPDDSPLDARLLATAPGLGADSFAILENRADKTQQIYRAGARFQNRTLAAVQWNRVIFRNGNRNEVLEIIEASGKDAPSANRQPDLWSDFWSQIRPVPHFEDGKLKGFRLFAVVENSMFNDVGFKSGDIVTSINGQELNDLRTFGTFYAEFARKGPVTAEITRNRESITLNYEMKEDVPVPRAFTDAIEAASRLETPLPVDPANPAAIPVARAEVDEAMRNLPELSKQIRAVTHFENGKPVGLRVFGIHGGSPFDEMGVKNGDIVTAINGRSVKDLAQATEIAEQVSREKRIVVDVVRDGRPTILTYVIE